MSDILNICRQLRRKPKDQSPNYEITNNPEMKSFMSEILYD